jgi:hypothetical protein
MADFDLGGLLFGNAPSSGLEGYLDPEQLKRMQQQGVMQAAMALLKASGPSTQRVGLGQALGEAYGAGQAGYQQAQQQGLAGMMTRQKLEEAERARKMQENYAKMVAGLTGGQAPQAGVMDAESALAAPVTAQLPAGPTIARSEMIGQPRSLGSPAVGGAMPRGTLTPQMASLLSVMPMNKGLEELYKLAQPPKTQGQPFKAADGNYYIQTENGGVIPAPIAPADLGAEEYGAPVAQVVNGKVQMVQYNKKGDSRIAQGAMPYEAQSPDIRAVEYLLGRNLGGTGAAGIGEVGNYRQQIAPKTDVKVNTGEKVRASEINKDIVTQMGDFTSQARSANDTLMNVDRILPALSGAITGPLADSRTTLIRVGQQLGIVGKDANDVLAKTQILVQGLAQQELAAAGQMKGQGAITAPERELLRRASVGDQSLSAAELETALKTAQKVARYRISQHQEYLSKFSALPGSEQYVPFYTVTPYQPAGGANPTQTGIDAELARRAQGQRGGAMR